MADPFLSQISAVSFPFAPRGWAVCTGQLMQVQQNQALYSLIGNQFGGTTGTSFNLPNCAGRTVIGFGTDTWGVTHNVGMGSSGPVSIGNNNLPAHSHAATFTPTPGAPTSSATLSANISLPVNGALSGGLGGRNVAGGDNTPNANDVLGQAGVTIYASSTGGAAVPLKTLDLQGTLTGTLGSSLPVTVTLPPNPATVTLQSTGSGATLQLTAPYLVQTVIMAVQGIFPTRP